MADNNTLRKDLGPVTAYAIAVEAGFEGTQEEWVRRISSSVDQQSFDALAASVASGDAALSDKIDTDIGTEAAARSAADTAEAEARRAADTAEATARETADTAQSGRIDTLSETVAGNDATLRNILVHKPADSYSPDGSNGQVLMTHGDGTTEWSSFGQPTPEQAAAAVSAWLDAHPEATTTVVDGSITKAKLDSELKDRVNLATNSLAPIFQQATANDPGTYVSIADRLYYLPEGHTADVTWENTTKVEVQTTSEIKNLSDDVSGLKSAIDLLDDGKLVIPGDWANGDIVAASGEYTTSHPYRIATVNKVTAEKDYNLTIKTGYQIYFYIFPTQGEIIKSGWQTGTYTLDEGAVFRAVIAKATEDTSSTVNIIEFRNAVTMPSDTQEEIDELTGRVSVNEANITVLQNDTSGLKIANDDLGLNGKVHIIDCGLINGNISTAGTPSTAASYTYMVFTSKMIRCSNPLTLTMDAGYMGVVHFYNSSEMKSANHVSSVSVGSGESVNIPAYQYFAFRMQRSPADTSTAFTPSQAFPHVYVDGIFGDIIDVLPDAWLTYLNTRIPQIKTAMLDIGNTGISFVFVTDVHIPRNNLLTPKIIQRIRKDVPVDYYINGGDMLDIETDGVQIALNQMWNWRKAMNGTEEIVIRGNHDNNNFNGENASNAITTEQFYALFVRPVEKITNTNKKTYFCVDNESQKVRLVFLDNMLGGGERNTMYSWMQTKLTELDSSWTVLVIEHYIWGSTTDNISTLGQYTIDAINAVYSQINADFIGILAGHTHTDYNATESVNGYLLIARDTNMVKSGTGTSALSFDYVTINTNTKKINFTKVGRGSDLSLSY